MSKHTPSVVDVAVIGGGPAGATVARLLALWGHRVHVLARPSPRPALAESLPPSCAKLLERLGVREAMEEAAFLRSTGNTVRWAGGDERVERFGGNALGYQVRRDALDRVLLREAVKSGAAGVRATVLAADSRSHEHSPTEVRFDSGRGPRVTHARWVTDCTGRAGLTAPTRWRR